MTKSLADFFQTSIFMTGTPAEFQKVITEESFHCDCPIYEAVEQQYVTRPTLNLIKCFSNQYNSAILAVYKNELEIYKKSKVKWPIHIIANCSSIDEVDSLYKNCWNSFAKKENIHLISIHTKKGISDKKTQVETDILPKLDNEDDLKKIIEKYRKEINKWLNSDKENCEPSCMMDILELIDAGVILKGEPVVLFQVDMISEGINLCSFNAGIIKSKADVKSTQQIGRIIRDYTITDKNGEHHKKYDGRIVKGKKTPNDDGHANIYSMIENENDICDLLERLEQFELTADSFDWGCKVDISTGSTADPDEDKVPYISEFVWEDITEVEIQEYRALFISNKNNKDARHIPMNVFANLNTKDLNIIAEIMNKPATKITNSLNEIKQSVKKKKKNTTKQNNGKKNESKKTVSVQNLINHIRQTIIHNQLEKNQPHGWIEWTKLNDAFITRYLANGNTNAVDAFKNVISALKDYLHLDENPNK
jgi:hypothetical protein